jgi:hypothetical protein
MLHDLVGILIPIIVGAVTVPLYDGLQAAITFLERFPAWVTRIIVGVGAYFLGLLVQAGVQLTGVDLTAFGQSDVAALAAAGLAFLFKLADRNEEV